MCKKVKTKMIGGKVKGKHKGLEDRKRRKKLHMDKGGPWWLSRQKPRTMAEYSPLKITTSPQLDYRPQ